MRCGHTHLALLASGQVAQRRVSGAVVRRQRVVLTLREADCLVRERVRQRDLDGAVVARNICSGGGKEGSTTSGSSVAVAIAGWGARQGALVGGHDAPALLMGPGTAIMQ